MLDDTARRPPRAGLRRATPEGRRASALADGFQGLPDGVTRWRVAAALRAAARTLGLTGPMLRLLEHYIDLTYDEDWTAGAEPVIIAPLVEIADHLGRSERQIRNIERALADRGLLAWRDSGNHHRKGRRDRRTGRLVYAYGPSLAPLGARALEIVEAARQARAALIAGRRLRIAISALRRRIRAELAAAAEVDAGAAAQLAARLAAIPARTPAGAGLDTLAARRDALAALAQETAALLGTLSPAAPAIAAAQISAKPEKTASPTTDTSSDQAMNGYSSGAPPKRDRADAALPIGIVEAAAGPALRMAMAAHDGTPRWRALVEAATRVAPLLGVDAALWGAACLRLGRTDAALAVLVIERGAARPPGDPDAIRQPPAYLRGMMARAARGELRLERSVRAWARRAAPDAGGGRQPSPHGALSSPLLACGLSPPP